MGVVGVLFSGITEGLFLLDPSWVSEPGERDRDIPLEGAGLGRGAG